MSALRLALLFSVLFAPAVRAEVPLDESGVQDRILAVFQDGVPQAEQRRIVESRGLEVLRVYGALRVVVARSAPGKAQSLAVPLRSDPGVRHVGRDFYAKWIDASPASLQQVPLPAVEEVLKQLPKLKPGVGREPDEVQWGVRRLNAPAAWPTNKGRGVKIAIVDTGIDPDHPEFAGRIKGGINAVDKDKPWTDDHFHGTHVAGIAAAGLDGKGVVGVAPEAYLYAVKVLDKDGSGSLGSILGGMNWCAENGMQVANMSLGMEQDNFLLKWGVDNLLEDGVVIVAAAGNDGKDVNFPAAYDGVIAVSALNEQDGIAEFSSRGPEVAFIAPGVKVPSTVPGGGIAAYSGTSMATPHVTGLAALAIAGGAQGPDAVRAALTKAAVKLDALKPEEQGAGVIDAGKIGL
ncbi:MAG: S8 family peptidase [Elusimicrobiota bacterium]